MIVEIVNKCILKHIVRISKLLKTQTQLLTTTVCLMLPSMAITADLKCQQVLDLENIEILMSDFSEKFDDATYDGALSDHLENYFVSVFVCEYLIIFELRVKTGPGINIFGNEEAYIFSNRDFQFLGSLSIP